MTRKVPFDFDGYEEWLAELTKKPPAKGVSNAARVPCRKSQYHGFHPADEKCPLCD